MAIILMAAKVWPKACGVRERNKVWHACLEGCHPMEARRVDQSVLSPLTMHYKFRVVLHVGNNEIVRRHQGCTGNRRLIAILEWTRKQRSHQKALTASAYVLSAATRYGCSSCSDSLTDDYYECWLEPENTTKEGRSHLRYLRQHLTRRESAHHASRSPRAAIGQT